MRTENHEKRTNNRVLFSPEDKATVHFYSYETDKIISAKVVNMSAGGMCLALVKEDLKNIPKKGEKLVLLKIESPGELNFILNINLEIVWALTPSPLEQIGIGCKFESIPKNNELQIEEFIHSVTTKH
jgi:c-di-GMP-binding flagellar brake protein YcgR